MEIQGVDISYCQTGLDYKKLKDDGIKFAVIRAGATGYQTHKNFADNLLNRHVNGCINHNIDYGFYYYSAAASVDEAIKEARFCVEQIKRYPLPSYPVFFDCEDMNIANAGRKKATDIALAFIKEVERLGYPSGIYCNPNWMESYLDKSRIMSYTDIWLAHWTDYCNCRYGQVIWQKGLKYSAGMNIDYDIALIDYPKRVAEWYKKHDINAINNTVKKSTDEIIKEIYANLWGIGQQRYDELTAAGYDYYAIQDEIERRQSESAKISKADIKVGSKVMVNKGARTYNGGNLASFVFGRPHIVTELVGDRAVICYGNVVVAAVNVKDLKST